MRPNKQYSSIYSTCIPCLGSELDVRYPLQKNYSTGNQKMRDTMFNVKSLVLLLLFYLIIINNIGQASTNTGVITPFICPQGHYCPQGTTTPQPCPLGTLSNKTGLTNRTDCSLCPPSYYCNDTGLESPCMYIYSCYQQLY